MLKPMHRHTIISNTLTQFPILSDIICQQEEFEKFPRMEINVFYPEEKHNSI